MAHEKKKGRFIGFRATRKCPQTGAILKASDYGLRGWPIYER